MFESVFTAEGVTTTTAVELAPFLITIAVAIACGMALAFAYSCKSRTTRSLMLSLALLPAIVSVVIVMVNGNVGAGVAVAGAFSLVRFRSVPGSARDIAYIFMAMGIGLVCGMGYLAYAAIVTIVLGGAGAILTTAGFGDTASKRDRVLRVTMPEDLDYVGLLADVFATHTTYHELMDVKTTNMGSLYRLTYEVGLKNANEEKAFIDDIRVRNGNLEVSLAHASVSDVEL